MSPCALIERICHQQFSSLDHAREVAEALNRIDPLNHYVARDCARRPRRFYIVRGRKEQHRGA